MSDSKTSKMYRISFIFSSVILFFNLSLSAQCYPDRHTNNWYDGWLSCEIAESPNPDRWDSHWILYNFGEPYSLGQLQIWNTNDPERLDWGLRQVLFDYSMDGVNWESWGQFEIEQATGESIYEGVAGPDFLGLTAQYVLVTGLNNHGGGCFGLSEMRFNIDADVANRDIIRQQNWCMSVDIFPNPFTEQANLSFKNNCDQAISYHLQDAFGRVISESTFISPSFEGIEKLDGSNLAAGIYFLVVKHGTSLQQYKLIRL